MEHKPLQVNNSFPEVKNKKISDCLDEIIIQFKKILKIIRDRRNSTYLVIQNRENSNIFGKLEG